jgi:hypothetical protein
VSYLRFEVSSTLALIDAIVCDANTRTVEFYRGIPEPEFGYPLERDGLGRCSAQPAGELRDAGWSQVEERAIYHLCESTRVRIPGAAPREFCDDSPSLLQQLSVRCSSKNPGVCR